MWAGGDRVQMWGSSTPRADLELGGGIAPTSTSHTTFLPNAWLQRTPEGLWAVTDRAGVWDRKTSFQVPGCWGNTILSA